MELHELHVLQRQAGAQRHAAAVAGAGVRGRAREPCAAVAAGRHDHLMRAKAMQRAVGHVESDHAAAFAIFHDQVEREVLDEEIRFVLQRLLIQGVQHGVAGAVGRGAGSLRDALAEVRGHAAERPLINAAILGARERHAVMLQFDDRGRRLLAHELDGVLIAEPVRALDRVVHVPAPIIGAHVAERRRDAALRGDRVAARREHLGQAGGRETGLGQSEGGAQSGAAGADDDHIVGVVDRICIRSCLENPNTTRKIANMPAAAARARRGIAAPAASAPSCRRHARSPRRSRWCRDRSDRSSTATSSTRQEIR